MTQEYRGYTLKIWASCVDIYLGGRHVSWALSVRQAKQIIDDMHVELLRA